jgi:hypothetical protein
MVIAVVGRQEAAGKPEVDRLIVVACPVNSKDSGRFYARREA